MRIAHFSDTHGLPRKPVPEGCQAIVISGDIAPNRTRGVYDIERAYQREWYRATMAHWKAWSKGLPIVLVEGNHDYFDPAPMMRDAGIVAYNVEGRVVKLFGLKFMGLPDIPWMGGEWNHERWEDKIHEHIMEIYSHEPDVIVAHCPPYGVLDSPHRYNPGYRIGSVALANALSYESHKPRAYLCGHCHEEGGKIKTVNGVLVSNAATSRNVLEV